MKKPIFYFLLQLLAVVGVNAQAPSRYSVDIPNCSSFYVAQPQANWCWAACNEMLLKAIGIQETQQNQIIKLHGELVDKGAGTNYELAKASLAGTYHLSRTDDYISVEPYVSYLSQKNSNDSEIIIRQLSRGIPLVMATGVHGRVCVGADYVNTGGAIQLTKLRFLNPVHPGKMEEFTMQDLTSQGLIGFMTVNVQ
ncbi:C39 family peptidase [Sabulibacter ruber]|uniref:C39 family peptidase n=1 Tax=Sabulibacter ruber TaxID=2811901 RepID=UPI001A9611CF|nr:papain-like cysteine protease family protein [Sabulibacter ruber]